jgi:formylglycine-generating enzyme required for sulfatase activity
MVLLPGGEFEMGSPEEEPESRPEEHPRHRVALDAFLIGKFEVSIAEWKKVMGRSPSYFRESNLPVEQVSWLDAKDFCRRAGLSLPTEAEWEYACRAGTSTAFAFGESITAEEASYDGDFPYRARPKKSTKKKTVPVDSFRPNGFGLHSMHGNVWEWCEDVHDAEFYGKPEATARNPLSTSGSETRVLRGGSWFERARDCRSAARSKAAPSLRSVYHIGFRVAYRPPGN